MNIFDTSVRVRFAETDAMGIVYHSNFLIWFEVGRVEYMRAAGFPYKLLQENEGIHLPVFDLECRFVHPAHYDDPITIRTSVKEITRIRLTFNYQAIHAESGELLAEGRTTHVFTDPQGKPKRLSQTSALWAHLTRRAEQ